LSSSVGGRDGFARAAAAPSEASAPPSSPQPAPAGGGTGDRPPRRGGGSDGPPGRITSIKTFESLQFQGFRDFFLAMTGQMASQNIQMVVRAYLAFLLTGSYAALGIIALANAIPGLILSLVGGALADRIPKRKVAIMVGQLVNAGNTLAIGMLLLLNLLTFEHLMIAAVVQGITMALMMPSRQAMIPSLVPPTQLMNAVALNAAGMNAMRLFAPALGGFLFTWAGGATVYFLMAGLYLLACVFLVRVPENPRQSESNGGAWGETKAGFRNMWEGLKYIKADPVMAPLLLINVIIVLLAMPYMFLLAGFVQDVLNAEADALGVLQSISGVSALAGALIIASMGRKRRGIWFLVGSALQGAMLFAGFVFSTSVWMMAAFMFFMGFGQAARQSLSNVLVQEYVQDAFRGRVMSIYMLQFSLAQFGAFFTGVLAALLGPRVALGGTSLVLVVLCLGALVFSKRLRNLQ
jgi:MFS family permease